MLKEKLKINQELIQEMYTYKIEIEGIYINNNNSNNHSNLKNNTKDIHL